MNFLGDFFNYKNHSTVCGLSDELIILYYYKYFLDNDRNVLIVTNNLYDSNKIFSKLKTYTDDVCLFPMDDFLASVAIAVSPDLKVKRLETLEHLRNNKKSIIVTNLMGYLRYLPSKKVSNEFKFKLSKNDSINRDKLIEVLDRFGYKRTTLVTSTGEYAIRGFIVDIFPIESDNPIRLEFFGDEIDSIRFFNDQTQLSINEVSSYTVLPFNEIETESSDSLFDYMDNPFVFFVDYNQIMNGYKKLCNDIVDYNESKGIVDGHKYMFEIDDIKVNDFINLETINNILGAENYNSKPVIKFKGDYEKFKDYCLDNKNSNKVVICLSNDKQIDRISSLFDDVNVGSILDGRINIIKQRINEGFVFHNYIFISEYDIDDAKAINNYKNFYKIGRKIKDFNDLKIGDYVVHSVHGIGIYGGIVPIKKGEMIRD
jgi:transcription-repair coupling factor (superfamily II helicase)